VSPLARVCRHGEIVPVGGSCPRCREGELARYRRRGSNSARGYDRAYLRLRRQVLSEEWACWLCGQPARPAIPSPSTTCSRSRSAAPATARTFARLIRAATQAAAEPASPASRNREPRREARKREVPSDTRLFPTGTKALALSAPHPPDVRSLPLSSPGHHRDQPPTGGRGAVVNERRAETPAPASRSL
jgi:hypothetical protein